MRLFPPPAGLQPLHLRSPTASTPLNWGLPGTPISPTSTTSDGERGASTPQSARGHSAPPLPTSPPQRPVPLPPLPPSPFSPRVLERSETLARRTNRDTNQDLILHSHDLPGYALRAGARDTIYQVPRQTTAAIVTSGPLCPGVNDVVRSLVWKLLDYGVPEGQILGIQRGFKGFSCKELKPIPLSRAAVEDVHLEGGTVLGTSSDPPDVHEVVKRLDLWAVDMLFVVGGYTDIKTAGAITRECARAHVPCSVIAVPKSIDNDILMLDKTFGFDTAVEEAQKALLAAKVEASSAYRGVGLVKLFGRHSGFIAVRAAMSSGVVDVVLIPEARFRLDGDTGLLAFMEEKLAARGHIVVCVADGAGKDLLLAEARTARARRGDAADLAADAEDSLPDIGPWLKGQFKTHLKDVDIKLIDPSYLIRSVPPTSNDRIYCKLVAHAAVHASFAAYTGSVVGPVNTHFCLLPISAIAQGHRKVDPDGELWNRMRSSIGQPHFV